MESKVLKLVHKREKKHFADLQENTGGGGGGGWSDLSGGIKGSVEVVLVASMCEHDSLAVCGVLCGLCPCCQIISFSFSPTAWSSLNVILSNLTCLHTYIFLMN